MRTSDESWESQKQDDALVGSFAVQPCCPIPEIPHWINVNVSLEASEICEQKQIITIRYINRSIYLFLNLLKVMEPVNTRYREYTTRWEDSYIQVTGLTSSRQTILIWFCEYCQTSSKPTMRFCQTVWILSCRDTRRCSHSNKVFRFQYNNIQSTVMILKIEPSLE